jgi:hypothetical protein
LIKQLKIGNQQQVKRNNSNLIMIKTRHSF